MRRLAIPLGGCACSVPGVCIAHIVWQDDGTACLQALAAVLDTTRSFACGEFQGTGTESMLQESQDLLVQKPSHALLSGQVAYSVHMSSLTLEGDMEKIG